MGLLKMRLRIVLGGEEVKVVFSFMYNKLLE